MNEKFFDLKKEKQDRMINASLKMFAENGFERASTDDIVKEAGISKGLLFHYFISKQGLYEFLFDYSTKFMTLETSSLVSSKETDYFLIYKQITNARAQIMRNYPYMYLFLVSALKEKGDNLNVEIMQKISDYRLTVEGYFSNVKWNVEHMKYDHKKIMAISEFTLQGLLEKEVSQGTFEVEQYVKEAMEYIDLLRTMSNQ